MEGTNNHTYLATAGVTATVRGNRTGNRALVHTKAMAKEDPLLVSTFASQGRSSGFPSALKSSSARRYHRLTNQPKECSNKANGDNQNCRNALADVCAFIDLTFLTFQQAVLDQVVLKFKLPLSCNVTA